MNRMTYTDDAGEPCIRLTATTDEEVEILKDLTVSKVRWLEVDVHDIGSDFPNGRNLLKGHIDLVDEVKCSEVKV